jgi:U3 small nucleolar RNA-associated protein MPP10
VGLESAVDKFVQRKKVPKNVKEAKGAALKSLVKSGKGVTVVGKDKVGVVRKGDKGKQKMKGTAKLPDGGSLKL